MALPLAILTRSKRVIKVEPSVPTVGKFVTLFWYVKRPGPLIESVPLFFISSVVPEFPVKVTVRPLAIPSVSLSPSAAAPMVNVPDTVSSEVVTVVVEPAPFIIRLFSVAPPPTKEPDPAMVKVVAPAVTVAGSVKLLLMVISDPSVIEDPANDKL